MSTPRPRSGPAQGRTGGAGAAPWPAAEAAVALGAACVTLHVVTALGGHDDGWARVLLLTMAAACVPCLLRLRSAPTRRTWAGTGGMYAAMLAAHLWVVTPWSAAAGMSHDMSGPLTWTELGMWGAMALAALQVLLAAVVLAPRPRGRPSRRREPLPVAGPAPLGAARGR